MPIRGNGIDIYLLQIMKVTSRPRFSPWSNNTICNSRYDVSNIFSGNNHGRHDQFFLLFLLQLLFVVKFFLQIQFVVEFWRWTSPWKQAGHPLSSRKNATINFQTLKLPCTYLKFESFHSLGFKFPRSYRKFVTFLIPYDHFCHSFNSKTLIVHNLSTLVSLLTPFKDKKTSEINILNNLYSYHLLQNSFMSRKKLTSVDSSTIKNWVW